MNTEYSRNQDIQSLLEQREVSLPQFAAINKAALRINRMCNYSDENKASFFAAHARDILYDCVSFQNVPVTSEQVTSAIESIQTIVINNNIPELFEDDLFLRLLETPITSQYTTIGDAVTQLDKKAARITRGIYRRLSFSDIRQEGRRYATNETEYDAVYKVEEVDEDETVRYIFGAISQIENPEDRQIILSLARGEQIDAPISSINRARAELRNILQRSDIEPEDETESRKGIASITESRIKLGQLVTEIGLQRVIQIIQLPSLSYQDRAMALYYLGYFHSDEATPVFEANERVTLQYKFGKTVEHILDLVQTQSYGQVPLGEMVKQLDIRSYERRHRQERIPSLPNDRQIDLIIEFLTSFPDRAHRITSPNQQVIISALLEANALGHVPNLHRLSRSLGRKTQGVERDLQRIFVKLYPQEYLMINRSKVFHGSYLENIIRSNPSPEVMALIVSEKGLDEVFRFLTTKNSENRYPSIGDMEKVLHINRRTPTALVALFTLDIKKIIRANASRVIALKALAIRLGATAEVFPVQEIEVSTEPWVEFVRSNLAEKLATLPQDPSLRESAIAELANSFNAPEGFISETLKQIEQGTFVKWVGRNMHFRRAAKGR